MADREKIARKIVKILNSKKYLAVGVKWIGNPGDTQFFFHPSTGTGIQFTEGNTDYIFSKIKKEFNVSASMTLLLNAFTRLDNIVDYIVECKKQDKIFKDRNKNRILEARIFGDDGYFTINQHEDQNGSTLFVKQTSGVANGDADLHCQINLNHKTWRNFDKWYAENRKILMKKPKKINEPLPIEKAA